jgi:DHA1 family multidrug resistance protein-like MFS transporter
MPDSSPNLAQATAPAASWVTRPLLQIIAAQVVFGFGWSLYLLTPKFLATALHADPEVIGLSGAAGGLAGLLTVPFAAVGLDRRGRLPFFRVGALLLIALSVGFLQVTEISPLVYVLQGCCAASWVLAFNATAALVADSVPQEKMGQAIGWLGGGQVATNALATAIAEPLAAEHGWDVVFVLGAVTGCATLVLSFTLREAPARAPGLSASLGAAEPSGVRGLGSILLATALCGGVFAAMFSFIQPYALLAGATEVRGFFLGFTLSAVACRFGLGGLGDRFGRRIVSAWMLGGYGLCAVLVARLDPDLLVLYGLCFGAAHGLLYPTMSALVLEVISPARRGLGLVLYNGAFNVGTAVSSLGWGVLAKAHGYPMVYAVATGLSALAVAALLADRRLPRTV